MTQVFTPALHLLFSLGLFWLGAAVGSFANVCSYRLPFSKSVIWPASHCPKCLTAISGRDNFPIFGWLLLRAECRNCGLPIPARYVLMELAMGLFFVTVHLAISADLGWNFPIQGIYLARLILGLLLVTFLVIATMMDYDWMIITDSLTVPGMITGLTLGTILPQGRPLPMGSFSHWHGFLVGFGGLIAGFAIVLIFRTIGAILFRREAMGLGDATLLGLIGSFLGWQATILSFFLASFFGLGHALWKMFCLILRWIQKKPTGQADREMPFGPYLSMAAIFTLLTWPILWNDWASDLFQAFSVIFSELA